MVSKDKVASAKSRKLTVPQATWCKECSACLWDLFGTLVVIFNIFFILLSYSYALSVTVLTFWVAPKMFYHWY